MKILPKGVGYLSNIERYDLNDVFSEIKLSKGLIICYTLATYANIEFVTLDMKAKHEEIGVAPKWHKRYSEDSFSAVFSSVGSFLDYFDDDDLGRWRLTAIYQNIEIVISGEKDNTEIAVSYSKKAKINLIPLFSDIETITYEYNSYDKKILNILKNEFGMTEKRAVLSIEKLQSHKDIYDEFVWVITSGKFKTSDDVINVESFTAEQLNENYPLSVMGAYNYLIYLREYPIEAMKDLKNGLPRK